MSAPLPDPLGLLRRLMLGLILISLAGTLTDLVLLKHYEDWWQIAPIALLGLGLIATAWLAFGRGAPRVHCFRFIMALIVAAAFTGMLLHYQGAREFQTETYPELSGWTLFLKIVQAKSPPALAPGAMLQLGLLGLLATFRHPSLPRPDPNA
jgi:hypothetical protein